MKFFNLPKNILIILLVFFVLLLGLIPSLYFYNKYQQLKKSTPTSKFSKEEIKTLLERVASHIVLPTSEEPTVATVSDKEKIKNQPFFSKTENGDKVIIFTKGKKAILYRPSIDKIIEVSTINVGTQSGSINSNKPAEKKLRK